jgi:hypothetical protein
MRVRCAHPHTLLMIHASTLHVAPERLEAVGLSSNCNRVGLVVADVGDFAEVWVKPVVMVVIGEGEVSYD